MMFKKVDKFTKMYLDGIFEDTRTVLVCVSDN